MGSQRVRHDWLYYSITLFYTWHRKDEVASVNNLHWDYWLLLIISIEIIMDTTSIRGSIMMEVVWLLSHVWLFVTPWTVARQAPLSMGFSRQEYWRGLLFSPPGDLSDSGMHLLHCRRILYCWVTKKALTANIMVLSKCKRTWKILFLAVLHFGRGTHISLDSCLCDTVEYHFFVSLLLKNQDILMTCAWIPPPPKGFVKVYILEKLLLVAESTFSLNEQTAFVWCP